MAKKKDYNVIEMNDKSFTIAERTREDSDVRMIPYAIKMFVEEVDNERFAVTHLSSVLMTSGLRSRSLNLLKPFSTTDLLEVSHLLKVVLRVKVMQ